MSRWRLGFDSDIAVDLNLMVIASKVLNGQGPGTRERFSGLDDNRPHLADRRCGALEQHQREETGELAWCGPRALAALLAVLATALLTLIVVRLWLKLENAALAILHPVRTNSSLRRSASRRSHS
jgi:hypothetical protein